jgi:Cof subfamily protein (haloacid dehalogenase superfamily)
LRRTLVVTDLDGTLLESGRGVDDLVRSVVRTARDRGALFTIATGRIFPSARAVALAAGIECPIIAGGGAVVGTPSGEVLSQLYLDRGVAGAILGMVGKGAYRYAFVGGRILTDTPGDHAIRYSESLGVPIEVVDDLEPRVGEQTSHIVLRMPPDRAEALVGTYASAIGASARVTRTLPHLIEFVNPLASKGRALGFLCSLLSVQMKDVIAVGDAEADLDMLDAAGVGVLVANAPPELRTRVKHVTRRPGTLGVLEVLDTYLPVA